MFLVVALVLSASFIGPAIPPRPSAFPAAPLLTLVTNSTFAMAGDNVSADVYTYTFGNLTDPSTVPVVSAANLLPTFQIATPVHVGTGHYHTSFTVPNTSTAGKADAQTMTLDASATVANTTVADVRYVSWVSPGLFVRVFAAEQIAVPATALHLTAEVYNGSVPVDADPFTVRFYPVTSFGLGTGIVANRTGVGVYQGTLTFAPLFDQGVYAQASVHNETLESNLTLSRLPGQLFAGLVPESYQAWYQATSSNATAVQGNLWIADSWGHPAPGVSVSLGGTTFSGMTAVTDAQGRIPLNMNLTGGTVQVLGTVGTGQNRLEFGGVYPFQACAGVPAFSGTAPVQATDPLVLPGGAPRDYLSAGSAVVRRFRAVNPLSPTVPMPNAAVSWYLLGWTSGRVYAAGAATTDADGEFALAFTSPPEDAQVYFVVAGAVPAQDVVSYSVSSPLMGLQVGALTLGGPTDLKVTFGPRGTEFAKMGVFTGLTLATVLTAPSGTWGAWDSANVCAAGSLRGTTGGLNTTLYLPSFLPASATFLLDAWTSTGSTSLEQHAVLTQGQSVTIPVGGPTGLDLGTLLLWAVVGVILTAIGVIGVVVLLRRKPKSPTTPPTPPPSAP